jgi:hypothetical protein
VVRALVQWHAGNGNKGEKSKETKIILTRKENIIRPLYKEDNIRGEESFRIIPRAKIMVGMEILESFHPLDMSLGPKRKIKKIKKTT